jgi:IS1 family transposase
MAIARLEQGFADKRRTDAACRQLLQKLVGCRITRYHTDNWQSYAKFDS